MSILTMPTTPNFRACRFRLRALTQQFGDSPSGAVTMKRLPVERWAVEYELPPMKRNQAAAWCAFLARCNGRVERFYAFDGAGKTARGNAAGSPKALRAGQTGTTLDVYGWTTTGTILAVGDYIAWDTPSGWREMHKVTADVTVSAWSAGYGNGNYGDGGYGYQEAQLTIAPPIRESPAADAVILVAPASCIMRLVDDEQAAWDITTALVYGIRFAAEEVWP